MSLLPKVAVVILNWNGRKYLEQFLPSVLKTSYPSTEIIVADNASTDDSITFLQAHFPSVKIIQNQENYGFAAGYNEALKDVEAEYFVLLNSDVEVEPDWIEPVIAVMEEDKTVAAAQPKLRGFKNKAELEYAGAAGGFIDKYGYPFCRGRIFDTLEDDDGQYDQSSEIFWASGAAFFIRRSAWIEVGGLDGDFFAHMEEIDLCWRLKIKGYKILYCPKSVVYHVGGGTLQAENPFKTYLNFRNNLFMLLKNLPPEKRFFTLFIRFWLDFISLLKFITEGKFKQAGAINKAHVAFFKGLRKNLRKTKGINYKKFNPSGLYQGSIVWEYFAAKNKKFSELNMKKLN
ncbi:glycosyltransferase family 2 protein [Desertivirga brevis]|uniref:glycosyltransferase family 2 protein n=1 Tax=Desertivirga brevis TaxID=2810310 RepID=UPI001A972010|nr:glycosyltransferase family 2 protein [Pedobacter sp. SYSU D00873]